MSRNKTIFRQVTSLLAMAASCAIILPLFGSGQAYGQSADDVSIDSKVILEDRYPDRKYQFPNGVTSYADVVYKVLVGYRPLILDLYLPPGAGTDDTRYPLVVVIHGGGWQSGHTRHSGAFSDWPAALASIANEGFVVASIEYRLSKEAPFPAAFDDVRDGIRWLRAHAAEYGINKSKVVVMGGSAGGQLAGLVGTACGDKTNPSPESDTAEPEESACVQGAVTWYGVFDFSAIVPLSKGPEGRPVPEVLARYLHCATMYCDEDVVRAASAISWVDPSDPPFLLIHGVDDKTVPVNQSRAMYKALQKAGVDSTLIEIPGVGHSFIGNTPETTINASRRAWDASLAFIKRVTGTE